MEPPLTLAPVAARVNTPRRVILSIVVLIVIFTVFGFIRYNSAAWTAKTYIDDLYNHNAPAATNLVCAGSPAAQQAAPSSDFADPATFAYTITSESMTNATVRYTGDATGTVTLAASGIGWCVASAG